MSKENTENQVEIEEDIVVSAESEETPQLDLDFNYDNINFEELSQEEQIKAFNRLKAQNLMVLNILKEADTKIKDLEAKSVSRVSEEQYQRLLADFENHKRRTQNQRSEATLDGKLEILKSMLTVLDTFERGISMVQDENSKKAMEMVQKSVKDVFAANNIEEINPVGEPFDPELHNAVMQQPAESEEEDDKVTEVFQKGYKKDTKVLRYAQVKVAKL